MKKFNFMNVVHIKTDRIGDYRDSTIAVGFESYPTNSEEQEGYGYYSFDEVQDLYDNNKCTDNVVVESNGKLNLKKSHMSYIQCFSVVNGIAFVSPNFKYPNILEYCKKQGYIHDTPQKVEMYAGIKDMTILDNDKYKIIYQVVPNKMGIENFSNLSLNHMEKVIIGSIKKLKADYYITNKDGENVRVPKCIIDEYHFDKETLTLTVVLSKAYLMKREFSDMLSILDLQIYYFYNQNLDYNLHFRALMQCQIDDGCSHIFEHKNDSDSNLTWHNKE